MASTAGSDDLDSLRKQVKSNAKISQDEEVKRRINAQYESQQKRLGELIDNNTTLPVTISSITVLNATNTRKGFLHRLLSPLLSTNQNVTYSLGDALRAVSQQADKLNKFDIFHSPISIYYDRPDPADPSTSPTDLSVFLSVREKSRFVLSSGTWAGSNDGSVFFDLLLRNAFGGAEAFNANASFGTRTRSAYSFRFDTPVLSNPDLRWEFSGLASSTNKSWASHEEVLRGGSTKLKWLLPRGQAHELGYTGIWRQATGLSEKASPTVRLDAGDSFKSSLSHSWTLDRRDYPLLPTRGYLIKTVAELAGLGPLRGDVAFGKLSFDTQAALPIPIPFVTSDSGASLSLGLRGGLLCPLALSANGTVTQSRINDRFFLGGPTDVRGFRHFGLGPHDGQDAVGGDVFAAGGATLLLPFPRIGSKSPLRFQAFVNGGRLLALRNTPSSHDSPDSVGKPVVQDVAASVRETLTELGDSLPSIAVGVGVVFALPVARVELNFSLPLVVRKGEETRKGVSLGVGIDFL